MRALFVVAAVSCGLTVLALATGAAASPRSVDDWSDGRGEATAAQMIEACVAAAPGSPSPERPARLLACVDTAFDACTVENGGRMSQYDLNVCRRASIQAWRARYDAVLAGFDTLFGAWSSRTPDEWQVATAARFRRQEADWGRWMKADCEMRELLSVGGTIHSFAVASCEQRHIALRAMDLSGVLEWWQGR